MGYPRELEAAAIPADLARLIREIGERLLSGPTATHAQLRSQLAAAHIRCLTLTGVGLFADLELSPEAARVEPRDMIGGEVLFHVAGLDGPAGSLVKVKDGRLEFIEVYTYGNTGFPDNPQLVSFEHTLPLPIPTGPANER